MKLASVQSGTHLPHYSRHAVSSLVFIARKGECDLQDLLVDTDLCKSLVRYVCGGSRVIRFLMTSLVSFHYCQLTRDLKTSLLD
jgi:hypothetical protein